MNTNRRHFIKTAGLGFSVAALAGSNLHAAAPARTFLNKTSKMHLGMVTYQLGAEWNIDTIIRNCEEAKFEGVELRTTHAHGVEVTLSAEKRSEVKKKFQNSKVQLYGLGSAFDYHTPDQAKLRKDIQATKDYILLAKDVGASGVKVRPNAFPKEVSKEKTIEQIGLSLRELAQFGQENGIQIRLEVHGSETSLVPNIKKMLDIADHKNVGACWNSNDSDLAGEGFDYNFNLIKDKIVEVHMVELFKENYPFRKLLNGLQAVNYDGFCLAEIPASSDPVRLMKYYRALWLAYQNAL